MSTFAIVSPSQTQKLFLEQEQFINVNDHFDCPVRNSTKLLNFIDTVFYEVNQNKKYPIVQKIKVFIKNLVSLEFSLPLLKQILVDFQKMDASLQLYQKHINQLNIFFTENQIPNGDQLNNGITSLNYLNEAQQSISNFYDAEFLDQNLGTFNMFNFYGEHTQTPTKRLLQKQKDTIKELSSTIEPETTEITEAIETTEQQFDTITNGSVFTKCSQFEITESQSYKLKQKRDKGLNININKDKSHANLKENLEEYKKRTKKNSAKDKNNHLDIDKSSLYIQSFKKLNTFICQMIIKDESIGKLVNAQINKEIQKLRLDQEISQKYRLQKNCLYQRHVKSSILNCKLKQRKKRDVLIRQNKK